MAFSFNIKITDKLTPQMQALAAKMKSGGLVIAAARNVANFLRDWFAVLEADRPNKMGFPRQHFWSDVRKSVQNPTLAGNTATVSINDPRFRQRLEGGTIKPVHGKYLTIPVSPDAYGKSPREFPDLRFGFVENMFGNLAPALIRADQSSVRLGRTRKDGTRKFSGKAAGGETMYLLVRQVYQAPDLSVMPTDDQLETAAVTGANEWLLAQEGISN